MKLVDQKEAIKSLKDALNNRNLTIYLGAGVSKPSGLPSWEQLVLILYFKNLNADLVYNVFPNYLLAISEWLLNNKKEPLETILRKIKCSGWEESKFLQLLRESIYSGFNLNGFSQEPQVKENKTLSAIINSLCSKNQFEERGLKSIITYNYDNLLEIGLNSQNLISDFQTVWRSNEELDPGKIPIYHVHGYIPFQGLGSTVEELVFSEEQYNNVFQDAYYWGNMIQMQYLAANTGLMIGISLNDRNMRRILDALKKSPTITNNFLLLKREIFELPQQQSRDIELIHKKAFEYRKKLEGSGVKIEGKEYDQIVNILEEIGRFESTVFNNIYDDMGINVLLYDDHDEIVDFIAAIAN